MPTSSPDVSTYRRRRSISREVADQLVKASRVRVQDSGVYEDSVLLPTERMLFVSFIFASTHHKFTHAERIIGQEDTDKGLRSVPVLADEPMTTEEAINTLRVSVSSEEIDFADRPDLIALAKSSRLFYLGKNGMPKDLESYIGEALDYSKVLWWCNKRRDHNEARLRPQFPRNLSGSFLPSISHDVMAYRVMGERSEPLHQKKDLQTTKGQYDHLLRFFDLSVGQQDTVGKPVVVEVRDGVAVYDLFSRVAFVARRQDRIEYDCMSEEILRAYAYGIEALDPQSPLRADILRVWNLFTKEEQEVWFKSWTPEVGIDPKVTAKVNGALPNQVPVLWLGRSDLRALLLEGKKEEAVAIASRMVDIVTGNITHLPLMLRAMIQTLASSDRLNSLLQTPVSLWFTELANEVNEGEHAQILPERVIDLTDRLSKVKADASYVGAVLPALLPIRQ